MEARYQRESSDDPVIKRIEIQGNTAFSRKQILRIMPSLRGGLLRKARYRESQLLADIDKLRAAYKAAGYLDTRVRRPLDEIAAAEEEGAAMTVTLLIEEGRRTYFRNVAFTGANEIPEADLRKAMLMRPGRPFDPGLLSSDAYRVYSLYADLGYAYARVVPDSQIVADSVDVTFAITEGTIATVGSIRLEGNARTLGNAIERELLVEPGDVFSRRKLLESQARLYRTALFSSVAFEVEGLEAESTAVDLVVRVNERQHRWFGLGVGYGTLDFLRVSGDWTHRNLFGSLVRAEARVVAARLLSEQDNNVRAEFTLLDPWLLGTRTEGAISIFHDRRDIENFEILVGERRGDRIASYRLKETGLRPSISREIAPRLKTTVAYNLTKASPERPSEPVDPAALGKEFKRSLDLAVELNRRNDVFNPTRGSYLRGDTEMAGKFLGGDSQFLRGKTSGSVYVPAIAGTIFALHAEVGSIRSLTDSTGVPDFERFRLGGASTVRGYDEEGIGPGNFLLITNAEVRIPLLWNFWAAGFLDGGNTWGELGDVRGADFRLTADSESVGGGDYRYSTGAGLRLATPVGAARLDYGHKLKRARFSDGRLEDPWAIHLSLGQPF